MKWTEIAEEKEENKKGTYAGVRFSEETKNAVEQYNKDNDIPNPIKTDKLHTTLLYSRKYLPDYKPAGKYDKPMIGKVKKFDVFESRPDAFDDKAARCLVLLFDCPELVDRFNELMDKHDATFDYDEYKPHITFSYDIGDMDIKDLPEFKGKIELVSEYDEDLNLNWAKDEGTK